MQVINTTVELIKLVASDGMVLTNGDTFCKTVYLGANDSPDNWREVIEAESDDLRREPEQQEGGEIEDVH